ncbi:hypothetical protein HCN44_003478 [Aphidius gifuensis]|uniref:BHLH domain-containing protein n=1 Tax=Aphidius gifuensis TaxID=684658 RepID=A0A834XIX7_APHGI|nr:uncharacterized protein LOC122859553 [Aphidius gifuensis]KAF7987615.1 hypothetical protein HCN44_003478 [Aphidius gifuensis]
MPTMGVAVYCNRANVNHGDQEQLMSLRTLQDNKSNILRNQTHSIIQKGIKNISNPNKINNNINIKYHNNVAIVTSYDRSRLNKHVKNGHPPPVAVARRNARERNRVKQVNNGFATLRQHIPSHIAAGYGDRGKKLSKVETLRMAVEYIRGLQKLLSETDGVEYKSNSSTRHNALSPTSSMVSSSNIESGEIFAEDHRSNDDNDAKNLDDHEDNEIKRSSLVIRWSPNLDYNSTSLKHYYNRLGGNEENLVPKTHQLMNVNLILSRLSPTSLSLSQNRYYGYNNEENLKPRILSPFSGDGDKEEGETVFAVSPEAFSGALYYKQEITETGEFMDVVAWCEQEQGRLVHHTQPHAQRLAHA